MTHEQQQPTATDNDALQESQPDNADQPEAEAAEPADGRERARGREAGYRRRLRETEAEVAAVTAERDQLRAHVDRLHAAEVERIAGDDHKMGDVALSRPEDVWLVGVTLDDLRGEDGGVDEKKVREVVKVIVRERPHWRRYHDPRVEFARSGRPPGYSSSWADALKAQ